MPDRAALIYAFIRDHGWGAADRVRVAGDASNRSYDRLTLPSSTAILMDAPPAKGEDVRPFVRIGGYLSDIGLSAPRIFAEDTDLGALLIEDLGDDLFARLLATSDRLEAGLYSAATDVLVHLHRQTPPALDTYDTDMMTDLACLAGDWYAAGLSGDSARPAMQADVHRILSDIQITDRVLIQRDYHAENLLWLPARDGVARVGLLDFQDALLGHPAYDLVSVLQDARRDVPEAIETQMIDRYLAKTDINEVAFRADYATLGLQRNLRILGVFARLCLRDGKAHYVDLIPRVWGHILTNLHRMNDTQLTTTLQAALPEPTPQALQHLKDQCATHRPS